MTTAPSELSVLVVDDESATRMMTRALLQRRGYRVSEAADGGEAVAAVTAAEPPFDVVLLDVQMPGIDGAAALASLRSLDDPARAGAAVIMLTARVDDAVEDNLLALGADAVMVKPLRWEALEPVLARCISASAGGGVTDSAPLPGPSTPDDGLAPIERMLADLPLDKVRHLLERAAANLDEHRTGIRQAAAGGNRAEVERLAHKIVGVAGTYGCEALRVAAHALEREAIRLEHDALPARVAGLDVPFSQALAVLERFGRGG